MGLKIQGTIHLSRSGSYELSCQTGNRTIVTVDGKKIFDLSYLKIWNYVAPSSAVKQTLSLERGDHSVEVITYFETNLLPDIIIKPLIGTGTPETLWSSFSF